LRTRIQTRDASLGCLHSVHRDEHLGVRRERGDALTFGPLRLDQTFLFYKDKRLAWSEVAKMQLLYNAYMRSIQFEVKAAGAAFLPWCVVRTQDIPNLNVFKMLAERKKAFTP
jgi:hypothetical protein